MIIAYLLPETSNPEQYYWRVTLPVKYMNKYSLLHQVTTLKWGDRLNRYTDILILPKLMAHDRDEALKFFNEVKAQGTKLVYDADDNMWSPEFVQYMIQLQSRPGASSNEINQLIIELETRVKNSLWVINQCDAVTVSTDALKWVLKEYTEVPIYVVPNAIDVPDLNAQLQSIEKPVNDKITIGWAGGSRPQRELDIMLSAWEHIYKEYENEVEFVIAGWLPNIPNGIPVTHIPWGGIDNYIQGMRVNIGCVSVSHNKFSICKSPIKAWEYAIAGAAVIGQGDIYTSEPIMHCKDKFDWIIALETYIKDAESRKKMSVMYNSYVSKLYNIDYNWTNWLDVYKGVISGGTQEEVSTSY